MGRVIIQQTPKDLIPQMVEGKVGMEIVVGQHKDPPLIHWILIGSLAQITLILVQEMLMIWKVKDSFLQRM